MIILIHKKDTLQIMPHNIYPSHHTPLTLSQMPHNIYPVSHATQHLPCPTRHTPLTLSQMPLTTCPVPHALTTYSVPHATYSVPHATHHLLCATLTTLTLCHKPHPGYCGSFYSIIVQSQSFWKRINQLIQNPNKMLTHMHQYYLFQYIYILNR